jgi:hypothetical protein
MTWNCWKPITIASRRPIPNFGRSISGNSLTTMAYAPPWRRAAARTTNGISCASSTNGEHGVRVQSVTVTKEAANAWRPLHSGDGARALLWRALDGKGAEFRHGRTKAETKARTADSR